MAKSKEGCMEGGRKWGGGGLGMNGQTDGGSDRLPH